MAHAAVPLMITAKRPGVHLLHSQRTDGGDKAGLVGLSLTERKAPTRTAREISA